MKGETLKEEYWKDGNIFELSTGENRIVWGDALINNTGYIPKNLFNDELVNTDSAVGECVIRVYSPNLIATCFNNLCYTENSTLLWVKSKYIISHREIRVAFGVPDDEELIIIPK